MSGVELDLNGVKLRPPSATNERLSMMVWGISGCGKTALASTLPGRKLWVQFDPDATASLGGRDDIQVADYSELPLSKVADFKEAGAMETPIINLLKTNAFDSVVIDSCTTFSDMALVHGITSGKANGKDFRATIEQPGITGYGLRNRYVLSMARMFLRATAMTNKHVCFICHEAPPEKNKDGQIISITVLLGGALPTEMPMIISECWHLREDNGRRTVYVRPFGLWRPMRTRMFKTEVASDVSFPFEWNLYTRKGEGVSDWYERWRANSFAPIVLPKSK